MKINKLKVLLKVGLRKLSHKNNDLRSKSLKKIGVCKTVFLTETIVVNTLVYGNCEFKLQYW